MTATQLITRTHFLQSEIKEAEGKRAVSLSEAERLRGRIAMLQEMVDELSDSICKECNGHGKLREWIAQDESRVVTCDECKGTGLASEIDRLQRKEAK